MVNNRTAALLSAALLLSLLPAARSALAQGYPQTPTYAPDPPSPVIIVHPGPPPPRVEAVPPPPPYPAVWRPGFWRWDGYRYHWVRGIYVRPPHDRHEWVPGHWDQRPGGWIWIEGQWR